MDSNNASDWSKGKEKERRRPIGKVLTRVHDSRQGALNKRSVSAEKRHFSPRAAALQFEAKPFSIVSLAVLTHMHQRILNRFDLQLEAFADLQ